jgi:hypothetical protein
MPYFWGNGLKQIRIKTIFFLKLTLKHELMDFLENSGIPVYPQKIERIGFQTTNGHVGDSVYPFSHHPPPPHHHHHQTSPTIINHSSTNIITIASEVCVKTMKSARSCLGKLPPADAIPVAGDDIGNHHPGHVTAFAMCFTVCG